MSEKYFDLISLFNHFEPGQVAAIRGLFTDVDAPQGATLFEQNSPADCLYIVAEGQIVIEFKPDDAPPLEVARIKPEGVLGWSAALGSEKYTSSAICLVDCRLLGVKGAALQDFYHNDPETAALFISRLAEIIAQRMRNTHSQVVDLLESALRIKPNPVYQDDRLGN